MKQLIPALVLIAVVAGMALWYRSRVGEPTRTVPESVRPSATDDRPWSAIRVPPPGYSPINRLKEKAPPGGDRFEVEIVDERIESALDALHPSPDSLLVRREFPQSPRFGGVPGAVLGRSGS